MLGRVLFAPGRVLFALGQDVFVLIYIIILKERGMLELARNIFVLWTVHFEARNLLITLRRKMLCLEDREWNIENRRKRK